MGATIRKVIEKDGSSNAGTGNAMHCKSNFKFKCKHYHYRIYIAKSIQITSLYYHYLPSLLLPPLA